MALPFVSIPIDPWARSRFDRILAPGFGFYARAVPAGSNTVSQTSCSRTANGLLGVVAVDSTGLKTPRNR